MTFSTAWNQKVYAFWAPVYDLLLAMHPVSKTRRRALQLSDIPGDARLLLLGAGTGADLEFLPQQALIIGVDLSHGMLVRARRKSTDQGKTFIPVCSDATRLPFADQAFDGIVLTLFVSVVPNPRECLDEAMRVLRPGGRMIVLDKFMPPGKQPSLFRKAVNLLTRPFGTDINRHWEDMSEGLGRTLVDEAVGMNGSLRAIVIEKPCT